MVGYFNNTTEPDAPFTHLGNLLPVMMDVVAENDRPRQAELLLAASQSMAWFPYRYAVYSRTLNNKGRLDQGQKPKIKHDSTERHSFDASAHHRSSSCSRVYVNVL